MSVRGTGVPPVIALSTIICPERAACGEGAGQLFRGFGA